MPNEQKVARKQRIVLTQIKLILFALFFILLYAYPAEAGSIPDTGQTDCYDNVGAITCPQPGEPFYGQDGNYTISPPSYTKLDENGNSLPDDATSWDMVRDNVTDLVWEIKQNADGNDDYTNPHDANNIYIWYDSNPKTNGGFVGYPGNGRNTQVFLESLNTSEFGGFSDWRLPTLKELSFIVDCSRSYQAFSDYFPNLRTDYWSSNTHAQMSSHAYNLDARYGEVEIRHKSNDSVHAMAVRGGTPGASGGLVLNGDGTVTDTTTGLMWGQKTDDDGPFDKDNTYTWQEMFSWVAGLNNAAFLEYSDWRVPNRSELLQLTDPQRYNPAIDGDYFPNTLPSAYWSSTTSDYDRYAWMVSLADGMPINHGSNKTEEAHAHAVRGGQALVDGNLAIVTPGQGSVWKNGDMGVIDIMPITWKTQGIDGDVVITLSRDGGKSWETIADSTPNNGSYDWPVTGSVSFNCVLRIEPLEDSSKSTTQGFFSISGDSDTDGLADIWEITYFPDLSQNESGDADDDGLANLTEYQMGLYPNDADTDNDGMGDGWELDQGFDPYTDDAGGDSDDDGFTDGREAQDQTDPFDPLSYLILPRATGRVPDTGQTDCYDGGDAITCPQPGEVFYGQDGNYTINPPSYVKMDSQGRYLADAATDWAMVRDNNNGLIWEIKQNKDNIEDYTNPNDVDNAYKWYDGNYTTNEGFAGYSNNGKNTETVIALLNEGNFGGFSDWRLPTIKELSSIVDCGKYDPAFSSYFPDAVWGKYWSSNTVPGSPEAAYCLDSSYGSANSEQKEYSLWVRAVRGGESQAIGGLVVNGDGTVTDTTAGLMWAQKTDDGGLHDKDNQYSWEEGLAWAQSLNGASFAEYSDWRLPNRNEMLQFIDPERYNPALDRDNFPYVLTSDQVTSTTSSKYPGYVWSASLFRVYNYTIGEDKNDPYHVLAVRGGQHLVNGNIEIIVPEQGSLWENGDMGSGDLMPISWETQGLGGDVAIYLSRNGGKTWETIADSTPNDGSYEWMVGGDGSFSCQLKIESLSDSSKSVIQGLFTINGDSDSDGMPDVWEITYFTDLSQNETDDPDSDDLPNLAEYHNSTYPNDIDTDNDRMNDGWEVEHGLNPITDDSGLDPDKDMFTNGREYQDQTDPQDPASHLALPETTRRVPDSGQTTCYGYDDWYGWTVIHPQPGELYYGQDATLLINPPSYLKMDSLGRYLEDFAHKWAIVRDNVTGLYWEIKQSKDKSIDHSNPHDADNQYFWYNDDPETNGGFAGTPGNGTDTQDFIQALNTANFGGSSDWRLPTIKELSTIAHREKHDPSIDTTYFPNIVDSPTDTVDYWTGTTSSRSNQNAGYVSFYEGELNESGKESSTCYVRAVRGDFTQTQDNFIKNGDQTVTDTATGLMWERKTDDGSINDRSNVYDYDQAYEWIETLNDANFEGFSDWRLPNINELISLMDTYKYPRINAYYFPNTMNNKYISSTSLYEGRLLHFWYLMFRDSETEAMVGATHKENANYYIRAVRGGQNQIPEHVTIVYPKQGSKLSAGSELHIEWETREIPGDVRVDLSRDGGKTWEVIADITPNDGEHSWTVTDPYSPNCYLRIVPQAEPTREAMQGLFSITPPDPPRAVILKAPSNPTKETDISITVGGDNILSYKYKYNDGFFQEERVVGFPIDLTNLSEGEYTISVIGKNITGDWQSSGDPTFITWSVDLTPPQVAEGSIIIMDNEGYTRDASPELALFASDAYEMRFALSSDGFAENWVPYASSFTGFVISPGGDGQKTIWVQYRDRAGNESIPTADGTIFDTTPPAIGSILIDYEFCVNCGGQEEIGYTSDPTPAIFSTGTASDFMRYEVSDTEPSPFSSGWNPYSSTYHFSDISIGGEGMKTVWAEFKDRLDNIQAVHASASIYYDPTPPNSTITFLPSFAAGGTIPITWSADDGNGSGVALTTLYYKREYSSPWDSLSLTGTVNTFNFTNLSGDGFYYLAIVSEDNLGNRESVPPIIADPEILPDRIYRVLYETAAAESQVTHIALDDETAEFIITYSHTDTTGEFSSEVTHVDLWAKGPGESVYSKVDIDTVADGKFFYQATTEGAYHFYTIAVDNAGNQESVPPSGYDMMAIYSSRFSGYAIIAVGSILSGEGLEAHTQTANHVYAHLIERNFALVDDPVERWNDPLDLIKYFNPYSEPQPGEDDYSEGSLVSYWDGLRKAITEWTPAKMRVRSGPLYLILVDHGTPDSFYLTGTQTITPSLLNEWVDSLEAEMTIAGIDEEIIIILGTCYSSSFIDELSKTGRIIVASSAPDEPSYRGPLDPTGVRDGEFFITSLFNELGRGENLRSSFLNAVERIEIHTDSGYGNSGGPYFDAARQHPYLDDNGDGVGSHEPAPGGDGDIAENIVLGFDTTTANPVVITEVIAFPDTLVDESGHSALLWAKVSDLGNTDRVWVEIRDPDTTLEGGSEQQLVDLHGLSLTLNGDRYEATYTEFWSEGTYTLFFYAKDTSGLISPFKKSYVYKEQSGTNTPPDAFNLLTPANLSEVPITTILDWEDTQDTTDGHSLIYTLTISTNSDLSITADWIHREEGIEHSVLNIDASNNIQNQTTYYWQVIALDEYGASMETDVWSFNTDNVSNPAFGWIMGYVYNDSNSDPIPYATVQFDVLTLSTDASGYYIGVRPPGNYDLSVTAPGFAAYGPDSVRITEGGTLNKNITLTSDSAGIDPIASIDLPSSSISILPGESLSFQGSVSGGDSPFLYLWDFNGGAINSTQKDPSNVIFNAEGTYTVTFTVTDDNNDSDSDFITVTVNVAAPDNDNDGKSDALDPDDDNDGITDTVESAGPNSGDANSDGIQDNLQGHVAAVGTYTAQGYVVLESAAGTILSRCQATANPSPGDAPADINFDLGFFDFTISGIGSGGSTILTMTVPGNVAPDTYHKYGKTPANPTDHWYEFLYNGETGAEINGNIITLHFTDALRGDDELIQDNMVIDLGAPGFAVAVDDDSGDTGGDTGGDDGGGGGGCFIDTLRY
jgi:uncharacterized protein DUF1566/carboxypeptidase family protein/PKD domain-containing protein/thrombospondin type 3 repeat protein